MKSVRVRMYRQGLGDCFLLTFPKKTGAAHVLIDCGVLKGSEGAQDNILRVARNIAETTDGKLDVLAATHEHWDHLSGFLQAEPVFKDIPVKEVWLSWLERPGEPVAEELAKKRRKAIKAISATARHLAASSEFGAAKVARRLSSLLEFEGGLGAAGRKTTHGALDWVRSRARTEPRWLVPTDPPVSIPAVDDVRVYVLGPPSETELIRKSNPSKKESEVYQLLAAAGSDAGFFAAVDCLTTSDKPGEQPFGNWYRISDRDARADALLSHYWDAAGDWRRVENDWLDAAELLALDLDSNTNNTSLVLAFELVKSGRVLLFPGDAQVGNWLSWQDREWTVKNGREPKKVTGADLLKRTVLYKVGHHGSHNATLREKGLEMMSSPELVAMIPVDRKTAKQNDWAMPFPSLFRRLQEKTRGRILDLERGAPKQKPDDLTDREWASFTRHIDVQKDWVDYSVEM